MGYDRNPWKLHKSVSDGNKKYLDTVVNELNSLVKLRGKVIAEIGPDRNLDMAHKLTLRGARKVHCFNSATFMDKAALERAKKNEKIVFHDSYLENNSMKAGSVDLIFAIATLEHIGDITATISAARRLLKRGGVLYLQGCPMWTSPRGHHIWIVLPSGNRFFFSDHTNPFYAWEHLCYDTPIKMKNHLARDRKWPADFAAQFTEFLFRYYELGVITKKTPTYLINKAKKMPGWTMTAERSISPNSIITKEYYARARKLYSEKDLMTDNLKIVMVKK